MHGSTGEGWLYALANETPSNWGDVANFYRCMEAFASESDEDRFLVESEVWGNLQRTDVLPQPGDGFAFYHSTRAQFPEGDVGRRMPRISLIGELRAIQRDGREIRSIQVEVNRSVLAALKSRPIVRKDGTKQFFERCGIVPGAVASLYHADHETWAVFSEMLRYRMPTTTS